MKQLTKEEEYTLKIITHINDMLNDEDCPNYIGIKDLLEGDNTTAFIHALATCAPAMIFNRLTQQRVNMLEFNHIANQLVFQFTKKE